ncbi:MULTISPECIES: HalOD1 output domain-containing protein [Halorussus]|uniref:HalOD1 output domain-containing protein n=1 Tax=Halorussus TaxID=1070314 RepID=UPI00209E748D|nr:HalOD1 output domain-containing protein [Halorussus vallis]USZ75175.1 hypothetical protein NGM07_17290 [Halorussus vallis]
MSEGSLTGESAKAESVALDYHLGEGETVADAVLSAVREISGRPSAPRSEDVATDGESRCLPPLFDAVNPDALDGLCSGSSDRDVEVSFPYAGYEVSVTGTNTVSVRELSPDREPRK